MTAGAWWEVFAKSGGIPDLETWLGGVDDDSRVRIRERVAEGQYESVLDVGCGLGLDYIGFQNLSHPCAWQGVEPSAAMRDAAVEVAERYGHDSIPIVEGEITAIPFTDRSVEFVYCRHVLEHLPRFEPALTEMLRVARLETAVVFFMRPGNATYLTREATGLWQNWWGKADIEAVLADHPRVLVWFWEHLPSRDCILHVMMGEAAEVEAVRVMERAKRD